jgi:hypothetical protein
LYAESQKNIKHSEESVKKRASKIIGKKLWHNQNGEMKKSFECPGEGWIQGHSKENIEKISKAIKQ